MDELLVEFIAETRETLALLAGEVVAWEAAPADRARLDTIFRFVHTVKGSCGFLDLPRLEHLSHAAESVLADVREGRRLPDGAMVSAVLAIVDRIAEMTDALDAGRTFPDGGDDALILALEPGAGPTPADPAADGRATPAVTRTAARSIRLPVDLLDRMMGGVSELVLARNELCRRLRDMAPDAQMEAAFERLSGCIADMRDSITRTRMQRIENLFAALPRMVRDLATDLAKPVALVVEGQDVELDREMIEMIRDPLTHIVRNAVDHGIEPAADRVRAGKPATGTLRVAARQAGNQILIEVADDGRGVDADRLAARAVAAGLMSEAAAARLPHGRRLALMFEAGLSTADTVTAVSGRGVGMDVVRANVERIGGVVEIDSRSGHGTRLTLRVPLTLTIIPALTVSAGGQHYAIPRSAIDEIVRRDRGCTVERIGGLAVARVRGRRLSVVDLGDLLGGGGSAPPPPLLVLVKPAGGEGYALAVDAVHDHEELVVKPAAPAVMATGLYAGTTLPDTGRPMLLLDPAGLAVAAGIGGGATDTADPVEAAAVETVPTLIFRDRDGARRAVRLALVERIEEVPADAVGHVAGRMRLTHNGRLIPLTTGGCATVAATGRQPVLLLNDGDAALAYAIDAVIDIRDLPLDMTPAEAPGPAAGAMLVDGAPVELLDAHWLFGAALHPPAAVEDRPLCVLRDAGDRWTREVLRPLIEAAGYRVALGAAADESGAVVIAGGDDPAPAPPLPGDAPVVRLRARPEPGAGPDDSIYRYDRTALLAAVAGARRTA